MSAGRCRPEDLTLVTADPSVLPMRVRPWSLSPMCTGAVSWPSPTGAGSPAGARCTAADWESAQWQRAHCVKNVAPAPAGHGRRLDEAFYEDLERDQRERATMSMLIPPQMLNTMVPSGSPDQPGFTEAFYADPVRRYMLPAFSDRRPDWPSHPYAPARLAARGRDVGGGGPDPPLPDQGAGRAAADLPAVLRPLHPDGPGRQLDGRRSSKHKFAHGPRRPARRDAGLPAPHARRARRGGLRRRRGQPALAAAGGLRRPRCWRSTRSATSGWPARR